MWKIDVTSGACLLALWLADVEGDRKGGFFFPRQPIELWAWSVSKSLILLKRKMQ